MPRHARQSAFTMIELMIVISIIVLMLAVAVPVVRSIQGNRSVAAGYNAIAAAMGHARQIALYYRAPAGVAFYKDPNTGYQDMAFVMQEKNIPQDQAILIIANSPDDRYMDIIPSEPVISLSQGLAVQVFNGNGEPLISGPGSGTPERYMRVGVVLFNEDGQLANVPYWVREFNVAGQNHLGDANHMRLNQSLAPPQTPGLALYSHAAVCLYDEESYTGQTPPTTPPNFDAFNNDSVNYGHYFIPADGVTVPPFSDLKYYEQNWLDQNGEVLVIKPNDGSLLRNK